jgi:DNA-binding NarL/FixJ family response regulator
MPRSQGPAPLRLLVVDGYEVMRLGLVSLLERRAEFQIVAQAGTVAQAIAAARKFKPDLIVMEARLPDGSGIEATRKILAERPATKVIILTSHPAEEGAFAAIVAGASGYVLKQTRAPELVAHVGAVGRGAAFLDPAVAEPVLERVRRMARHTDELTQLTPRGAVGGDTDELAALTPQERQILLRLAEGKTNQEIAAEIVLTRQTVKNYVSSILSKLNLRSRAEAPAFVMRHRMPSAE